MSKRLYRSETDKIIGGVCRGLADYLNIDPVIVRVLFIIASTSGGFGLTVYILLWIVIPSETSLGKDTDEVIGENTKEIRDNVVKATKGIKQEVKSDTKKK